MLGKVRQPTELAIDPHSGNYVPAPTEHLQPRSGIVPLELLLVPKEIDGSLGDEVQGTHVVNAVAMIRVGVGHQNGINGGDAVA